MILGFFFEGVERVKAGGNGKPERDETINERRTEGDGGIDMGFEENQNEGGFGGANACRSERQFAEEQGSGVGENNDVHRGESVEGHESESKGDDV